MLSGLAIAQDKIKIDKVRTVEFEGDEATITFWSMNQVFRMPANSKTIPCLENAWKAEQDVALKMAENTNAIKDCRLYNGGIPLF